jgi:hypothetical protein
MREVDPQGVRQRDGVQRRARVVVSSCANEETDPGSPPGLAVLRSARGLVEECGRSEEAAGEQLGVDLGTAERAAVRRRGE